MSSRACKKRLIIYPLPDLYTQFDGEEPYLEESGLEDLDDALDGRLELLLVGLVQAGVVVLQQLQGPVGLCLAHRHNHLIT